ncbi:MAG TPA: roadblock/LC7 domain-containing protein [Thermoleophilaceae bacterium]|nr:roadblock/LC7 domain-containing protein [Thermoleophilaceae bacterium]
MAGTLTPERTAERLCELSADARAAVLLDAAGSLAGFHGVPDERSEELAELARELFEAVDRADRDIPGGPPEQVETQVEGGTVYASRTPRWTLAMVGRRAALSSLMLMDLRAVLGELEEGRRIHRSSAAEEPGTGEATEEEAAGESPVPELGREP